MVHIRPVSRVSDFYGIVIYMYRPGSNHPPLHFHARYGEHIAQIELSSLRNRSRAVAQRGLVGLSRLETRRPTPTPRPLQRKRRPNARHNAYQV